MRACRMCLSKDDLCPLFGEYEFSSHQLFLSTGVKIEPDDGLPQTACKSCMKTISKSLHLRQLSSKADEFLKSFIELDIVKSEPNIEDMIENIIDPFSIVNHQRSHVFIRQSEQTNYMNESNEVNEYDRLPSNDTKPIIENDTDDIKLNDDDLDNDSEELYKTEFVSIETKQEHTEYDGESDTKTVNCITLSKDAQIMLYPTKDSTNNILNTTKINEHSQQTPTAVSSQALRINQVPKPTITKERITKDTTKVKHIKKCKTDEYNCRSEFKNKQKDSTKAYDQGAEEQTATTSVQTTNNKIEDFISSKELNELFKDAHKFGKKANTSDQTVNISGAKSHILGDAVNISSQIETGKSKDNISKKESHKILKDCTIYEDDIKLVKRRNIDCTDLNKPVEDQPASEEDQDHEDLFENLMSKLKENLSKYIPNDTQECSVIKKKYNLVKPKKMDSNRRKYFQERNRKLMSLAVTPYSDGPVQCGVCGDTAQNKQRFRSHALKHFDKQHACQFAGCGKKFVHRSQLSRHQQCRHGVEKLFSCGHCDYKAADRPTMKNHIRAEHTGERPYECAECGARFRMRNNIIQHLLVHFRPTRTMQCEYCPSRFQCRRDLWIHQDKTHFYSYNYYCYLCPNTYKGGCSVRKHLLKVHGVPKDQQLKIRRDKIRKPDAPSSSNIKAIVSNTPR